MARVKHWARVYPEWKKFRDEQFLWFRVAESTNDNLHLQLEARQRQRKRVERLQIEGLKGCAGRVTARVHTGDMKHSCSRVSHAIDALIRASRLRRGFFSAFLRA